MFNSYLSVNWCILFCRIMTINESRRIALFYRTNQMKDKEVYRFVPNGFRSWLNSCVILLSILSLKISLSNNWKKIGFFIGQHFAFLKENCQHLDPVNKLLTFCVFAIFTVKSHFIFWGFVSDVTEIELQNVILQKKRTTRVYRDI